LNVDRSGVASLDGARQRSQVEVDGGVRRPGIASLPSSSTRESRSTSSSTFVGVDIERHGSGYERATFDESSDVAIDVGDAAAIATIDGHRGGGLR
jgi:hypothetical protein